MMEVAFLTKNVKLKLTREQLASLNLLATYFLHTSLLESLEDKTVFFLVWEIYEGKIRKKALSLKPEIGLTLDLPHAWALMQMCMMVDLTEWPYEESVARYIIQEIDHQTV
jgi:hypothetical protein